MYISQKSKYNCFNSLNRLFKKSRRYRWRVKFWPSEANSNWFRILNGNIRNVVDSKFLKSYLFFLYQFLNVYFKAICGRLFICIWTMVYEMEHSTISWVSWSGFLFDDILYSQPFLINFKLRFMGFNMKKPFDWWRAKSPKAGRRPWLWTVSSLANDVLAADL